jgi:hypothetical protein
LGGHEGEACASRWSWTAGKGAWPS